jgi:hypothetical protein
MADKEKAPRLGYSINEYCTALGISRGTFYNRLKDGTGPKVMKVGSRSIITPEAHEEFRRRCEGGNDAAG